MVIIAPFDAPTTAMWSRATPAKSSRVTWAATESAYCATSVRAARTSLMTVNPDSANWLTMAAYSYGPYSGFTAARPWSSRIWPWR